MMTSDVGTFAPPIEQDHDKLPQYPEGQNSEPSTGTAVIHGCRRSITKAGHNSNL